MCRFVILRDTAIWLQMSLLRWNLLIIVCIDSKTFQSLDEEIRSIDKCTESLGTMFVGRFEVPGIEEPVDEETSGAGFDVSAGQARDWCFRFRRRFLFIPRLFQLILCGAHVLFSPGENLRNKLRRHIEQSRHLNSVLGLVIFGFKKVTINGDC